MGMSLGVYLLSTLAGCVSEEEQQRRAALKEAQEKAAGIASAAATEAERDLNPEEVVRDLSAKGYDVDQDRERVSDATDGYVVARSVYPEALTDFDLGVNLTVGILSGPLVLEKYKIDGHATQAKVRDLDLTHTEGDKTVTVTSSRLTESVRTKETVELVDGPLVDSYHPAPPPPPPTVPPPVPSVPPHGNPDKSDGSDKRSPGDTGNFGLNTFPVPEFDSIDSPMGLGFSGGLLWSGTAQADPLGYSGSFYATYYGNVVRVYEFRDGGYEIYSTRVRESRDTSETSRQIYEFKVTEDGRTANCQMTLSEPGRWSSIADSAWVFGADDELSCEGATWAEQVRIYGPDAKGDTVDYSRGREWAKMISQAIDEAPRVESL